MRRQDLLLLCALSHAQGAMADEGGVSFWLPGNFGSFAAVPSEPGWTLPAIYFYGDAAASASPYPRRTSTLAVVWLSPRAPASDAASCGSQSSIVHVARTMDKRRYARGRTSSERGQAPPRGPLIDSQRIRPQRTNKKPAAPTTMTMTGARITAFPNDQSRMRAVIAASVRQAARAIRTTRTFTAKPV